MTKRRTYWHLEARSRVPNEYDIVTSNLLYYRSRGFEVNVPLGPWYARYQESSPLRCSDWERFADPRQTTYTSYVEIQQAAETFVDGVLRCIDESSYDRHLSGRWLDLLARLLAPLRYPLHGLQMAAAYVAQMAPSSRVTIAALLQAADEMRRIHRIAYRIAQLRRTAPGFAEQSRETWQSDPAWQPLREAVEKLLVCFDWAEALVALNLVVKPALERGLFMELGAAAQREGDSLLGSVLASFAHDGEWHRQWSESLLRMAVEDRPQNAEVIEVWAGKWKPLADGAVAPLTGLLR
jgi:toluene monooxygenase system protein E